MYWFLGALGVLLFSLFGFSEPSVEQMLPRGEAKRLFPSSVVQWLSPARQAAARHGVDPRVLLSIAEQESSGQNMGYHPDGESYGLLGLTDMALADLGIDRALDSLSAEEQFQIGAEVLALWSKQEGSLFEALKWYNSGAEGGRGYAEEVLQRAGFSGRIPTSSAQTNAQTQGASSPATAQGGTDSGGSCQEYGFCDGGSSDGQTIEEGGPAQEISLGNFTPDLPVNETSDAPQREGDGTVNDYRSDEETESQEEKLAEANATTGNAVAEIRDDNTLTVRAGGPSLV